MLDTQMLERERANESKQMSAQKPKRVSAKVGEGNGMSHRAERGKWPSCGGGKLVNGAFSCADEPTKCESAKMRISGDAEEM